MVEDMELQGLSASTRETYVHAVNGLARYYGCSPDRLSEEQLREYFLYLINDRRVAPSTLTVYLCGIKFFYESTLKRQWQVLELVRPKKRKKLPVVLSREEVRRIVSRVRCRRIRMCLTLIYSCGLRVSEGTKLQVADIDSARMVVRVREGKGGKDRYVPLAQRPLELLRTYWVVERPRLWLFPARQRHRHLAKSTVQKAFKSALSQSGIFKNASVHTLRHSYATHLLESGVNLHLIQQTLGHKSPRTTTVYMHLTQKALEGLQADINELMVDL